jgi:cytochrome c553
MKTVLKIVGVLVLLLIVAGIGVYAWASSATNRVLTRKVAVHEIDIPVPFPLDSAEVKRMRLKPDSAQKLALSRGIERGRHLIESRYACKECHGDNLGGGVMVDAAPVGVLHGPNITMGKGSKTVNYRVADWDRIVRHGVRPDSTPAVMPSVDFQRVTDQELSDLIAYIRSMPPVDNEEPPVSLGPILKISVAMDQVKVAADEINHDAGHPVLPPDINNQLEYGKHMATICIGCHKADFSGGPIIGGPPDWPPAANITPAGIGGYKLENFMTLMRTGKGPAGNQLREPMGGIAKFGKNMTDQEIAALFAYLQTVPPVEIKN